MAENDGDHSCILSAGRSTQQDGAVGEYLRMQERFNEVGAEASATGGAALVCVPGTSAEKLERWAARRACWRWGRYPPPGHARNTLLALRTAHTQVVLCRRAGCAALVDMQAARRRARAAGRDVFEIGDGCAGPLCSVRPWPQRFARRQASMAKALGVGSRMLMLWPPSTAARQDQWAVPPWLAAAIANAVLAEHAPPDPAVPPVATSRAVDSPIAEGFQERLARMRHNRRCRRQAAAASSAAASLAAASPAAASPAAASVAAASPVAASLTIASPTIDSPAIASPAVAEPPAAEPTAAEPTAAATTAEPAVAEPTATEPTAAAAAAEPAAAEPAAAKPTARLPPLTGTLSPP
jgi:hypothetical protein